MNFKKEIKMANSGYVVFQKEIPSLEQIKEDVKEILKKFPNHTITFTQDEDSWSKEGTWVVSFKENDYLSLVFWISKFKNKKCIEFRHGHSSSFSWWVEAELREGIGRKYNAKIADDAYSGYEKPSQKSFKTIKEYFFWSHHCNGDENWNTQMEKIWKDTQANFEKKMWQVCVLQ